MALPDGSKVVHKFQNGLQNRILDLIESQEAANFKLENSLKGEDNSLLKNYEDN